MGGSSGRSLGSVKGRRSVLWVLISGTVSISAMPEIDTCEKMLSEGCLWIWRRDGAGRMIFFAPGRLPDCCQTPELEQWRRFGGRYRLLIHERLWGSCHCHAFDSVCSEAKLRVSPLATSVADGIANTVSSAPEKGASRTHLFPRSRCRRATRRLCTGLEIEAANVKRASGLRP